MDIHELARQNQQSAWKVLEDTCIIEAWERIGATVHLVGSLRTGLLAESEGYRYPLFTTIGGCRRELFGHPGTCGTVAFAGNTI